MERICSRYFTFIFLYLAFIIRVIISDLFHLSHHNAVSSTLTNKPQTTYIREHQIRHKWESLNLSQQNALGIKDVNKLAGSSIDVARFDYFDTICNPLICSVYRMTVLDTAIGEVS